MTLEEEKENLLQQYNNQLVQYKEYNNLYMKYIANLNASNYVKKYYKSYVNNWYNANITRINNTYNELLKQLTNKYEVKKSNKYACLVGINYTGTVNELKGCENDVYKLKDILIKKYNYQEENITLLLNSNATKINILDNYTNLIKNAKNGDSICFTFSGHGYYAIDKSFDEKDGQDELLVPHDLDFIYDDDLKKILDDNLQEGVQMFSLIDSCHSGTMLDLKYKLNKSNGLDENKSYKATKGQVIMLSGSKDYQLSYDAFINSQYNGVLTYVLTYALENNENKTWIELVENIRKIISDEHFDQTPQLSFGQSVVPNDLEIII